MGDLLKLETKSVYPVEKIIEKINKYQGVELSIETAKKYQNMAEEILNK